MEANTPPLERLDDFLNANSPLITELQDFACRMRDSATPFPQETWKSMIKNAMKTEEILINAKDFIAATKDDFAEYAAVKRELRETKAEINRLNQRLVGNQQVEEAIASIVDAAKKKVSMEMEAPHITRDVKHAVSDAVSEVRQLIRDDIKLAVADAVSKVSQPTRHKAKGFVSEEVAAVPRVTPDGIQAAVSGALALIPQLTAEGLKGCISDAVTQAVLQASESLPRSINSPPQELSKNIEAAITRSINTTLNGMNRQRPTAEFEPGMRRNLQQPIAEPESRMRNTTRHYMGLDEDTVELVENTTDKSLDNALVRSPRNLLPPAPWSYRSHPADEVAPTARTVFNNHDVDYAKNHSQARSTRSKRKRTDGQIDSSSIEKGLDAAGEGNDASYPISSNRPVGMFHHFLAPFTPGRPMDSTSPVATNHSDLERGNSSSESFVSETSVRTRRHNKSIAPKINSGNTQKLASTALQTIQTRSGRKRRNPHAGSQGKPRKAAKVADNGTTSRIHDSRQRLYVGENGWTEALRAASDLDDVSKELIAESTGGKRQASVKWNKFVVTKCLQRQIVCRRIGSWTNKEGKCDFCQDMGRQCVYFVDESHVVIAG